MSVRNEVDPFSRFKMVPAKGKQPGEGGSHQPAEQVPSIYNQADVSHPQLIGFLRGGVVISLVFPKVPQSSLRFP